MRARTRAKYHVLCTIAQGGGGGGGAGKNAGLRKGVMHRFPPPNLDAHLEWCCRFDRRSVLVRRKFSHYESRITTKTPYPERALAVELRGHRRNNEGNAQAVDHVARLASPRRRRSRGMIGGIIPQQLPSWHFKFLMDFWSPPIALTTSPTAVAVT